jgi:hypothetical protein
MLHLGYVQVEIRQMMKNDFTLKNEIISIFEKDGVIILKNLINNKWQRIIINAIEYLLELCYFPVLFRLFVKTYVEHPDIKRKFVNPLCEITFLRSDNIS